MADWETVAAVATVATFAIGVWQLHLAVREYRHQFEHKFVERYWKLAEEQEMDHKYLRLSEDQFEVMRLGQIRWSTWAVWHEAIRDALTSNRALRELVTSDKTEFEWLRECCKESPHLSGLHCPAVFKPSKSTAYKGHRLKWSLGWLKAAAVGRFMGYTSRKSR